MAFLSIVRSRGERYVYITEYCGNKEFSSSRKKHVFALGKQEDALYTLQAWDLNYDNFPQELKNKGYNRNDIKKWIQDIKEIRKKLSV